MSPAPVLALLEDDFINALQEAVIVVDSQFKVLRLNRRAKELFDASPLAAERHHPRFLESKAVRESWHRALRKNRTQPAVHCVENGNNLDVNIIPLAGASGLVVGGLILVRRFDALDGELDQYDLTPREREIAGMLLQGHENKHIADVMSITSGTVKVHIHHLYEKTGAASRIDLFRKLS